MNEQLTPFLTVSQCILLSSRGSLNHDARNSLKQLVLHVTDAVFKTKVVDQAKNKRSLYCKFIDHWSFADP
jgi:hypothetical protein